MLPDRAGSTVRRFRQRQRSGRARNSANPPPAAQSTLSAEGFVPRFNRAWYEHGSRERQLVRDEIAHGIAQVMLEQQGPISRSRSALLDLLHTWTEGRPIGPEHVDAFGLPGGRQAAYGVPAVASRRAASAAVRAQGRQVAEGVGVSRVRGDHCAAHAFVCREAVPRVGEIERFAGRGAGRESGHGFVALASTATRRGSSRSMPSASAQA